MKKTSLPIPITVKKIIKENFKTKTFITDINLLNAKPGQFVMIWLPELAEKPFSLTNNKPFAFTVQAVGKFTKTLNNQIRLGDKIWYRGPFGNGTFKNVNGKKILVAGGCGCVPLYFFAKSLKNKKDIKDTKVIVGAKDKQELLFYNRFKKLGFETIIVTDNGSQGIKGFATDVLENILKQEKIACVYSCGPKIMLKKIAILCQQYKTKYQLSLEALMKCGFGICGSCSIGGKLVCHDGPVFSKWPGKLKKS